MIPQHILDRIAPEPNTGCWLWAMSLSGNGYGNAYDGHKVVNAHRWVYEQLIKPIPDGLQLDHLYRVRSCVNPEHLEIVTQKENLQRSPLIGKWKRPDLCKHGHMLSGDNLIMRTKGKYSYRGCKICRRGAK